MKLEYELSSRSYNSKPLGTYRNPIVFAQELAEEMSREELTQAELARKHGLLRARFNQWLSLLKLPEKKPLKEGRQGIRGQVISQVKN